MSRCPAVVAGPLDARPAPGAVAALAARLSDRARAAGLALVRIELSRLTNSRSHYLLLEDARGRRWTVRVSNHHRPHRTGHFVPHFDFVSRDAAAGLDAAADYLGKIARGEIAWTPPQRSPRRKGVK